MLLVNNILQFLDLENTNMGIRGFIFFSQCFEKNIYLEEINLAQNNLIKDFGKFFEKIPKFQLKNIDLSHNKIEDESLEKIAGIL